MGGGVGDLAREVIHKAATVPLYNFYSHIRKRDPVKQERQQNETQHKSDKWTTQATTQKRQVATRSYQPRREKVTK